MRPLDRYKLRARVGRHSSRVLGIRFGVAATVCFTRSPTCERSEPRFSFLMGPLRRVVQFSGDFAGGLSAAPRVASTSIDGVLLWGCQRGRRTDLGCLVGIHAAKHEQLTCHSLGERGVSLQVFENMMCFISMRTPTRRAWGPETPATRHFASNRS